MEIQTSISGMGLGSTAPVKKTGTVIKVIAGVVGLMVLGTGISLATRIWNPLWNPFRPDSEKVIAKMGEKMKEVKTLHIDLNAELSIKNESEFNIKAGVWSDGDNGDPQNLKSAGGIDINFAMEGMQFSLGLETKQIGEVSYIKLTTIPALPLLEGIISMTGIDLDELKNQWVKADEESLKKLLGEEYYGELMKEKEEQEKKQETMIEEFKKIIENKKLYLVKKELPDEKIGEVNAYHYVVVLNNDEIKKIIPELFKTMGESFGESDFTGLSEARLRAKEARIVADMMQMRTTAEMIYYYDYSYNKLSCNYSDASLLCEDIAEYAGNEPVIFASDQKYCAFTPLLVEGYYYCIDSGLNAVTTNVNPQETGYCNGRTFTCPSATEISEEDYKKATDEEFSEELDKFFGKIGELSGELWIGKRDNLFYRFKGEKSFALSQFSEGEKGTISVRLNIDFSKFNQPMKIESPEQYKNLDEILGPIIGELLGGAQTSAKDTRIIADMGQIRVIAELLYDEKGSYKSLCAVESAYSTPTLNEKAPTYGKDLADLENDIRETQGGFLDLFCGSSVNSYCIDVELISPEKGRYCIDSSFVAQETADNRGCLGTGTSKNPYRCP